MCARAIFVVIVVVGIPLLIVVAALVLGRASRDR